MYAITVRSFPQKAGVMTGESEWAGVEGLLLVI